MYSSNGDPFYSVYQIIVTLKAPTSYIFQIQAIFQCEEITTINELAYIEGVSETKETQTVAIGKKYLYNKSKCCTGFCYCSSDEFQVLTQTVGETEVQYYYFSDNNPNLS